MADGEPSSINGITLAPRGHADSMTRTILAARLVPRTTFICCVCEQRSLREHPSQVEKVASTPSPHRKMETNPCGAAREHTCTYTRPRGNGDGRHVHTPCTSEPCFSACCVLNRRRSALQASSGLSLWRANASLHMVCNGRTNHPGQRPAKMPSLGAISVSGRLAKCGGAMENASTAWRVAASAMQQRAPPPLCCEIRGGPVPSPPSLPSRASARPARSRCRVCKISTLRRPP